MNRSLITLNDLDAEEIRRIVDRSIEIAAVRGRGLNTLSDKTVGVYFGITSTRTRTSFALGATLLGASTIQYSGSDLQLNTGESMPDTARVLGNFLDAIVVRDKIDSAGLIDFSRNSGAAIINAMSFDEHPTQGLTDLATIKRQFGDWKDLNILYLGEGNSTAIALALAAAKLGDFQLYLATPPGYGIPQAIRDQYPLLQASYGRNITEVHDINELPAGSADVIYTTRWQTTGTEKPDPRWRDKFAPFQINQTLFQRCHRNEHSVFMHDLPAHREEEVTADVIDGDRSIVFMQAEQKLYTGMASLEYCLGA
ncbi:MAG: ornithine carbamoyltransferase [Wenzhouxiangellaceae bacterium]